ncbi:MAG: SDR family oxidoreductase [Clostridiales bacterium]|nr:SDR family oxidoreductase [Clostridiales bacterium]
MKIDLTDFCAVITGSSSGLGHAMAEALLENGATVAVSSRPGDRLDRAVSDFRDRGYRAFSLPMDVRFDQDVASAADTALKEMGQIDLLINNAGIGMPRVNPDFVASPKPFYEMDTEGVKDVIETNFLGYFTVSKHFVQPMLKKRKGRIVNISTSLPTMTRSFGMPYGPAKAGAEALTVVMTDELRAFGITVNTLLPGGAADTPLMTEKNRADFLKFSALLDPNIMKKPILFLASPLADNLTCERIIAKEFDNWLKEKSIAFDAK